LIRAADGFEDSGLLVPMCHLREAGHKVVIAGREQGQLTGKHGCRVKADCTFAGLKSGEYGVLLTAGAFSSELRRDRAPA
jgi:protease I